MISNIAVARLYVACIIIGVGLLFLAPWIADLIFVAAKAIIQGWAVGAYN